MSRLVGVSSSLIRLPSYKNLKHNNQSTPDVKRVKRGSKSVHTRNLMVWKDITHRILLTSFPTLFAYAPWSLLSLVLRLILKNTSSPVELTTYWHKPSQKNHLRSWFARKTQGRPWTDIRSATPKMHASKEPYRSLTDWPWCWSCYLHLQTWPPPALTAVTPHCLTLCFCKWFNGTLQLVRDGWTLQSAKSVEKARLRRAQNVVNYKDGRAESRDLGIT